MTYLLVLLLILSLLFVFSVIVEIFGNKPEPEPEPEARKCPHDRCRMTMRTPHDEMSYIEYREMEANLRYQIYYYQKLFLESKGFQFEGRGNTTVKFYMDNELQRVFRTGNLEDVIDMVLNDTAFPTSDWVDYE